MSTTTTKDKEKKEKKKTTTDDKSDVKKEKKKSSTDEKSDLKKEKRAKEKEEKALLKEKEKAEKRLRKEQKKLRSSSSKAARRLHRSGSDLSSNTETDDDSDSSLSLSSSSVGGGPLSHSTSSNASSLAGSINNNNNNSALANSTGATTAAQTPVEKTGIYASATPAAADADKEDPTPAYDTEMFTSESFLIALADSDHLGPAIKSVFEMRKEQDVINSLNQYVSVKEADIEKICGDHHEGFINSVTTFLGLKEDNLALNQSVKNLNYELQQTGTRFVNKAEELFTLKRTKDNIRRTKEILNNCQYAILMGMKIKEHVKAKRYYLAIKNMDQLHNVYLKRLNDFQFARNMSANIPVLKEEIKMAVKDEFNSWMVLIKEKSVAIGRFGMIQAAKSLEKEREINPLKIKTTFGESELLWDKILGITVRDSDSIIGSLSSNQQSPGSPSFVGRDDLSREDITQISPFDEHNIDFHPLYQCLFIYSSLGILEEFQGYYTLNRLLQFQMVVQPKEHGQVWEAFLQQIAGYFMVESKVMDSTHPYLSKTTNDDCWNTALVKITSVLQELFTHCHDTHSLIAFKKFVLLFTNTLAFYSYPVQSLLHLLETMKEKYCQFAIREGVELFTRILENEDNINLEIKEQDDYETLILANNLDPEYDAANAANTLPKQFPFSKLVPQFYTLIKKFIAEFYEFADQLTENENFIIRSTDTLIKKISEVLHNYLTMAQQVPQIIQLVINLHHLFEACNFFKEYLSSLILGDSKPGEGTLSTSHKVTLSSANQLYATKGIGEKLIFKLCSRNIEDLMSSEANINWSPNAYDENPRDYIEGNSNLFFVQQLSPVLREEFITKAFKKISEILYGMIHGDSLKKFNLYGVKAFNFDLKRIEEFAKVKAAEKERTVTSSRNLVGYFAELRQVVNLLMSDNPEEFADPKIRARQYNLITNYPEIIILFNKYKEESKGFSTPADQKARNKKIQDAIKNETNHHRCAKMCHIGESSQRVKLNFYCDERVQLSLEGNPPIDTVTVEDADKAKKMTYINIMAVTVFLQSIGFTMTLPSMLKYLENCSSYDFAKSYFAIVVACYSAGQFIGSPIFGYWGNKRSPREPINISIVISIVGRFIVGIGAGNVSTCRAVASESSEASNKTQTMGKMSGSQGAGFVLGPAIGFALSFIHIDKGDLHLDQYTLPGYFSALTSLFNIIILMWKFNPTRNPAAPVLSANSVNNEAKDPLLLNGQVTKGKETESLLAVCVSIFLFAIVISIFAVFETILTLLTADYYKWTPKANYIIMGGTGILSVVVFIIIAMPFIKKIDDRKMAIVGLVNLCVSLVLLANYPQIESGLPKWQFYLGSIFLSIGYPIASSMMYAIFSKVLHPNLQGTKMGWLTSGGSIARLLGPLWSSPMFNKLGGEVLFLTCTGLSSLAVIVLLIFYKKLSPHPEFVSALAKSKESMSPPENENNYYNSSTISISSGHYQNDE
eukprot:gene9823-11473_t